MLNYIVRAREVIAIWSVGLNKKNVVTQCQQALFIVKVL